MSYQLTLTPISGDAKRASNEDYKEQKERNSHILDANMFWCWDDSKTNKSKKGDYFGFFFPESKKWNEPGKVIIHRINDVKSPKDRLPSWSRNVGQTDRNVLILSPPIDSFTMEEWKLVRGPMKRQGTYTTIVKKENKKLLYKFLSAYKKIK